MKLRPIHISTLLSIALSVALPAAAQFDRSELSHVTSGVNRLTTAAQTGPSGIITTVAGDGYAGDNGNGGLAIKAQLILPSSVAVDRAGNFYVADEYTQTVRKVTAATGVISIYAGTGVGGYFGDGGLATKAKLDLPNSVAVDSVGNLYIGDGSNNVVRRVDAKTHIITTFAGNGYGAGSGGVNPCFPGSDGVAATSTPLCFPQGLAVDVQNNVYFISRQAVRKVAVDTGIITTIAGNGSYGYAGDGELAVNARFGSPFAIAIDSANNLYIADQSNCAIRKVTASTGVISSLIGVPNPNGSGGACGLSGDGGPASAAKMNYPQGIAIDPGGNLFISDTFNSIVRVISAADGNIYTVAGSYSNYGAYSYGNYGYAGDGGPATAAIMLEPQGLALDSTGNLFVADQYNSVIRKVTNASALPSVAPIISPVSGTITKATTVKMTAPVKGSTIYYTTDGTLPTTSSAKYVAPFNIARTEVITAFAVIPNSANSGATTAAYLYAPVPVISPASRTITAPITVTVTDANPTAKIYYTTDWSGVDPRDVSRAKLYGGPVTVKYTTSFRAAVLTTAYDASGNAYSAWSDVKTVNFLYAPAPTITPGISIIAAPTTVTIADLNPYVQTYYTLDGSNPVYFGKTVKGYGAPITISATTVLKAAVWTYSLDGSGNVVSLWSPVTTATFTLAGAPTVVTKPATSITTSSAVLNGALIANTGSAQYWFAYGTDITALTSTTQKSGSITGKSAVAVTASVTGLSSKTTYFFQLLSSNATGTTSGFIQSFTTN